MSAAIKPEIYISWIPTGQIGLKPQIFATFIQAPHYEKITADLSRNISKPETVSGDLKRKIGNGEKVSADVSRHVVSTDTVIADTERKLSVEEKISGDTLKKIVQSAQIHADTFRDVQATEKIIGDTARKIGVTTTGADLQRRVNVTTKTDSDTCRRVGITEKISADTIFRITCAESVHADTFREVKASTVASTDTNRKIGVREKVSAGTRRLIAERVSAVADTLLQTVSTEKAIADLQRGIREFVRADTSRRVTRAQKAVAKTVIRVPHVLNYRLQSKPQMMKASKKLLAADNPLSLVNTFKDYGVTEINITLSEKTLSDTFTFNIAARSVEINEAVQGWLLDYPFSFLVEETNQTDLVQTVKGRYSIDDLIYTWFYIPTPKVEIDGKEYEVPGGRIEQGRNGEYVFIYPTATEIVYRIARYFGMLPVVLLLHDFTPSNLDGDNAITYADLLSSVFGWTSKLPHMQVNVFIRGGVLYCIQRGREVSTFDITNLPHSRPTVNKKFNRVLCYNPNKDKDDDDDDDDNLKLFTGTIAYSGDHFDLRYEYTDGFLRKEYQHIDTGDNLLNGISGKARQAFTNPDWQDTEWTTSNGTTETTYTYITFDDLTKSDEERKEAKTEVQKEALFERYIETKTSKNTTTQTTGTGSRNEDSTKVETEIFTEYHYAEHREKGSETPEIYLVAEVEITHTTEYEFDAQSMGSGKWDKISDEVHIKKTFHIPAGNGWYGQMVILDGAFQGANLSQGKPGNRISAYTVSKFSGNFTAVTTPDEEESARASPLGELSWIVDDSFPVRDAGLKYALNSALRWLHRKTEETVTVNLISRIVEGVPEINHIVDFTERILFNGAEYFLVSNQISFTPRKLIQKLTLIRWY